MFQFQIINIDDEKLYENNVEKDSMRLFEIGKKFACTVIVLLLFSWLS